MFGFSRTTVGPTKDERGAQVGRGGEARSQSRLHNGFDPVDSEEAVECFKQRSGGKSGGSRGDGRQDAQWLGCCCLLVR